MAVSHRISQRLTRRWGRIVVLVGMALLIAQLSMSAAEAWGPENRQSCSAITGTQYKSHEERAWYWQYCLGRPLPSTGVNYTAVSNTSNSVLQQFANGYRAAGGPEQHLNHILYRVIPCESSANPFAVNGAGPFYGLMQFYPPTWQMVGGGDWFNPWMQGHNTAKLLQRANPATQWPVCWFA